MMESNSGARTITTRKTAAADEDGAIFGGTAWTSRWAASSLPSALATPHRHGEREMMTQFYYNYLRFDSDSERWRGRGRRQRRQQKWQRRRRHKQ